MDILRAILLSLEAMIEDPELQVNGFVLIIDWSNFTFKQASKLTPSMLRLAIEGLQVSVYCCYCFFVSLCYLLCMLKYWISYGIIKPQNKKLMDF